MRNICSIMIYAAFAGYIDTFSIIDAEIIVKEVDGMNMIRPVSDLRNNFADISKTVRETAQPVLLTPKWVW